MTTFWASAVGVWGVRSALWSCPILALSAFADGLPPLARVCYFRRPSACSLARGAPRRLVAPAASALASYTTRHGCPRLAAPMHPQHGPQQTRPSMMKTAIHRCPCLPPCIGLDRVAPLCVRAHAGGRLATPQGRRLLSGTFPPIRPVRTSSITPSAPPVYLHGDPAPLPFPPLHWSAGLFQAGLGHGGTRFDWWSASLSPPQVHVQYPQELRRAPWHHPELLTFTLPRPERQPQATLQEVHTGRTARSSGSWDVYNRLISGVLTHPLRRT